MKDGLKDQIKAYVAERVKKELNRDGELESLQQLCAQWLGTHPDHFEGRKATDLWACCKSDMRRKHAERFADYFYNQIKKGK